jgi:hypothetical protein
VLQTTLDVNPQTDHIWHNQAVVAEMADDWGQVTLQATQRLFVAVVHVALHHEFGCQFWAQASHCSQRFESKTQSQHHAG